MHDLYTAGVEMVRALVEARRPLTEAMAELLNLVHGEVGREAQVKLAQEDWEADAENVKAWVREVLTTEPPGEAITAYWFGLFQGSEPPPEEELLEGDEGPDAIRFLYISGSPRYRFDAVNDEWMLWRDDTYMPEGRYFTSDALQRVLRLEEAGMDSDVFPVGAASFGATTVLTLGYAALAVHQALRTLDTKITLGKQSRRAVAIGFDSGDVVRLPDIAAVKPARG